MKEVPSCRDDCFGQNTYQNTDSIHLNYDDVDKVVDRYKDKYALDLVGQNLWNSHVDLPS